MKGERRARADDQEKQGTETSRERGGPLEIPAVGRGERACGAIRKAGRSTRPRDCQAGSQPAMSNASATSSSSSSAAPPYVQRGFNLPNSFGINPSVLSGPAGSGTINKDGGLSPPSQQRIASSNSGVGNLSPHDFDMHSSTGKLSHGAFVIPHFRTTDAALSSSSSSASPWLNGLGDSSSRNNDDFADVLQSLVNADNAAKRQQQHANPRHTSFHSPPSASSTLPFSQKDSGSSFDFGRPSFNFHGYLPNTNTPGLTSPTASAFSQSLPSSTATFTSPRLGSGNPLLHSPGSLHSAASLHQHLLGAETPRTATYNGIEGSKRASSSSSTGDDNNSLFLTLNPQPLATAPGSAGDLSTSGAGGAFAFHQFFASASPNTANNDISGNSFTTSIDAISQPSVHHTLSQTGGTRSSASTRRSTDSPPAETAQHGNLASSSGPSHAATSSSDNAAGAAGTQQNKVVSRGRTASTGKAPTARQSRSRQRRPSYSRTVSPAGLQRSGTAAGAGPNGTSALTGSPSSTAMIIPSTSSGAGTRGNASPGIPGVPSSSSGAGSTSPYTTGYPVPSVSVQVNSGRYGVSMPSTFGAGAANSGSGSSNPWMAASASGHGHSNSLSYNSSGLVQSHHNRRQSDASTFAPSSFDSPAVRSLPLHTPTEETGTPLTIATSLDSAVQTAFGFAKTGSPNAMEDSTKDSPSAVKDGKP